MSDSVSKYQDMQDDFNCKVGRVYPVINNLLDIEVVIHEPEV